MGITKRCCKLFLFIFNALFLVAGIAILAIGIWTVLDKVFVSDIIGNDMFTAAAYMVIVSGLIVFGVCILGFVSLSKESRILVIVYFIVWVIIFLVLIVGAIIAVVFRGELESEMRNSMKQTLSNKYGVDTSVTASWDRVQRELRCCSVDDNDWTIYTSTKWFKDQDPRISEVAYVPASCCVVDLRSQTYLNQIQCQTWQLGPPRNPIYTLKNRALYDLGCYKSAKNFVMDASSALIAVGFAFGITLVSGLIFTLIFLKHISTLDDEEIQKRAQSKTPNDGL